MRVQIVLALLACVMVGGVCEGKDCEYPTDNPFAYDHTNQNSTDGWYSAYKASIGVAKQLHRTDLNCVLETKLRTMEASAEPLCFEAFIP